MDEAEQGFRTPLKWPRRVWRRLKNGKYASREPNGEDLARRRDVEKFWPGAPPDWPVPK